MTSAGAKQGPLTQADIQAIWEGAVDLSYSQALEAAGEGAGWEAYTQMFAQFARVSQAIDTTTQAMYILPWSGQSAAPADLEQQATVQITIARNGYTQWALVLLPGQFFIDEYANDWGTQPGAAGVQVLTGRRYTPVAPLVFPPGDSGPYTVACVAEKAGYGYNNPQPNTLQWIDQVGSGYTADRGTITLVGPITPPTPNLIAPSARATLTCFDQVPMLLPQHLGQYVQFTAGANQGVVARLVGYIPAAPPNGSAMLLGIDYAIELASVTGAFVPGEVVWIGTGHPITTYTATGVVLGTTTLQNGTVRLVYTVLQGSQVVTGKYAVGQTSGAYGQVATTTQGAQSTALIYTAEAPANPPLPNTGATWRVLDWVQDWGITATNAAQPTGGRSGMLVALGKERNIALNGGETANSYRQRIAAAPDVVSPNAIKRQANKQLGQYGPACLREVGFSYLPGFYYDRLRTDTGGDWWDTDCLVLQLGFVVGSDPYQRNERIAWVDVNGRFVADGWYGSLLSSTQLVLIRKRGPNRLTVAGGDMLVSTSRPLTSPRIPIIGSTQPLCALQQRYRVWLDYLNFRASFLLGVANIGAGDFGFCYDSLPLQHIGGFYDRGYNANFYDGFPVIGRQIWGQVYRAVEAARAGGVSWTMYRETIGCP